MSWNLTADSVILVEGDSKSDLAFPYQEWRPIQLEADAVYAGRGRRSPRWVDKAVNGSQIGAINTRLAAELAANAYTHVYLNIGTNERAVARAVTQAGIAGIVTTLGTLPTLMVTDYAWGEKYPTGQNVHAGANDTRLDETAADLIAAFVAATHTNLNLRTGVGSDYVTVMPPLNLPSPGATAGPYTEPDTAGAHRNGRGRARLWDQYRALISFG